MPGNCDACAKAHQQHEKGKSAGQLIVLGEVPPDDLKVRAVTPCRTCPKHQLYPDNFGLHPANQVAVDLYYLASGDQYVGLMDGARTVKTLSVNDARGVLDEFDDHFPTSLERQSTFRKMMALDHVATSVRREAERIAAERAAKPRTRTPASREI